MALNKNDVEKIAHLARLQISDSDALEVGQRVSNILEMIDQMQNVDTADISPMAHPFDAVQRLRADQVTENNQRDYLQKLASATQDGLYLVPRVIE